MAVYLKDDRNLFDISKVNGLVNQNGGNLNRYFVKDGDRINVKYGAYALYTYLTGNEVYLEAGTYTFSADVYLEPNQESYREAVYMSIRNFERKQHITALHEIVYPDIVTRFERNFTVENAGIYQFGLYASGNKNNYTNIPIWFSNIKFTKLSQPVKLYIKDDRNLFDISKIVSVGSCINNGDGTLSITTRAAISGKNLEDVCPELKAGDTVRLSMKTDSDAKYIKVGNTVISTSYAAVITETMLKSRVYFYGYSSTSAQTGQPCIISNIQIEKGEKVTPYSPYGYQKVKVKI